MNGFENEDEKEYYFQEDSPKNTAYKDLYNIDEMLEEIYISKNGDVIPLSAIEDSIITGAKGVLKKEKILWYKKRERGNGANGYE